MHHHARRLVDHHQVFILIDHVERYVLRLDGRIVVRTVEHQRDDVSRAYLIIIFNGCAVHVDEARVGGLLYAVAAGVGLMLGQELVDAHRLLPAVHLYAEVLIQLAAGLAVIKQLHILQLYVVHLHPQILILKSSSLKTSKPQNLKTSKPQNLTAPPQSHPPRQ